MSANDGGQTSSNQFDDLTASLEAGFAVTANNIYDQHPRFSMYKNEGKASESQRARRQECLDRLQRDREKRQDRFRALYAANGVDVVDTTGCLTAVETEKAANIADDPPLVADKLTEDAMNDVVMAWNSNVNNKKKKAQRGRQARPVKTNSYADYLMFSEWLVDIPCELSTEWLMVPCPLGKRCLVVSENGKTVAYNKMGYHIQTFASVLPKSGYTLLDCIYDKFTRRFYVLDLLCWNNHHYADTEFEFRRFFLRSKFEESPELQDKMNRYTFHFLPSCECNPEAMAELMKSDFGYELDGLLFYYSKIYYVPGQTPLIGWLKPWMLPEILGVPVPDVFAAAMRGYNSSQQFIDEFNDKHHFKSCVKKQDAEIMDKEAEVEDVKDESSC